MKKQMKKMGLAILALALCLNLMELPVQAAGKVKVKAAAIKTSTGGDFVKGVSKAVVSFQITGAKSDVTVSILNDRGKAVCKKTFKNCKTNTKYKFTWDGKGSNKKYVAEGNYRAKVEAGKSSKKTAALRFIVNSDFAGGDGSKTAPYKVANIAQLKNIVKHNGMRFVQSANINLDGQNWIPLFAIDNGFSGIYDGKGYTISNANMTSESDNTGIFRCIAQKGVVKNLKMKDCIIAGNKNVGTIAGYCYGSVLNCSAEGCTVNANASVAVFVGYNDKGKIESCSSVNNTVMSGDDFAGAIVGQNAGTVKACSSKADVVNATDWCAGGIAGYNKGTIMECVVEESCVNANSRSGGIAGGNESIVKNCTVYDEKGQITCGIVNGYKGGIIGHNAGGGLQTGNVYYGNLSYVGN